MCLVNDAYTTWKNNPLKNYFENKNYTQKENAYTQFKFIIHMQSKTKPQLHGARMLRNFICPKWQHKNHSHLPQQDSIFQAWEEEKDTTVLKTGMFS